VCFDLFDRREFFLYDLWRLEILSPLANELVELYVRFERVRNVHVSEDRLVCARRDAGVTVNAVIRIDEQLIRKIRGRCFGFEKRIGGAAWYTAVIFAVAAEAGDDVGHEGSPSCWEGVSGFRKKETYSTSPW